MEAQSLPDHKIFKPKRFEADKRRLDRIPVRENEGIKAAVLINGRGDPFRFNVEDISSLGLGLQSEEPLVNPFQIDDRLTVALAFRDQQFQFPGIVCHLTEQENRHIKLGLLRINQSTPKDLPVEPFDRIAMKAVTRHPYYYNEDVILTITAIARNDCTVECLDPEFLVFPAMPISMALHIFQSQNNAVSGRVTWQEITPGKTRFGMVIEKLTETTRNAVAAYLFHLHDWKPIELRSLGFDFKGYRPLIKFRSMRTHDQYLEVLKLRRSAYLSAGKIDKNCTDGDLASDLDRKSRIVLAYHHERLVGTVSLLFPDRENMILDTEKTFTGGYPIRLPLKQTMIEVARLCITPDYRATDILHGIFEQIYRILITSGREYILSSTDDRMWPLYRRIGFKKTGMSYDHPVLKGIRHHVMLLHKDSLLFGKGISPFVWLKFFMHMTDHLLSIGALRLSHGQKARVLMMKIIFAVAKRLHSLVG